MWLFAPNLATSKFTALCVIGGIYYLHAIGLLGRIFGLFRRRRNNNNNNEPQHRDPNAADDPPVTAPQSPLTYIQLLQRFLIGIFASLWPTWDHRNLYPPIP
eukprot:90057_1